MANSQDIITHYQHGNLLTVIEQGLQKQGKKITELTIDDLAAVDEFHLGGRQASEHLFAQLPLTTNMQILDIGCGLGGAARFVAQKHQCYVYGVDLQTEYINSGNKLSEWLKLATQVNLINASATCLPFYQHYFDAAYMLHLGMNIADKKHLFNEVARVVKQGGYFAIYDVLRQNNSALSFPLPWASNKEQSYVERLDDYQHGLISAGFEIIKITDRKAFILDFFKQTSAHNKFRGGLAELGLHTLMQDSFYKKLNNLRYAIENNIVTPVEIIARKG